ncbi:MAG: nucleotidyltransferase family protein [Clostridiales bacterium]|nr:nucleotidyltransferase family protein [Clostridiales bacterium]
MSVMMEYLSELIHAQLKETKPGNIPEGIHIEELEAIAHRNHMEYLLLGALLRTDLDGTQKQRFKAYVIQGAMRSLTQAACLLEFEERCEKEGIYHQLLKGSVLKGLYPSPELREMSDMDVMIYDEDLRRAKSIIEEMGFSLYKSVKHHDIYRKPPFLVMELHHALYDKDVDKVQYEYYRSRKQLRVKEGRKYALQFSIEDFYIYMIAHMAKHFYETGCGIRNIMDVYMYRSIYEPIWDEDIIEKELSKCNLSVFEARICTLSKVWLGGQEADSFSEVLFHYMSDSGIYGKGENGVWGKFALDSQANLKNYKAYAKRWYYFPPRTYMVSDYPWLKKAPFLLFAAWGIRAVHGLLSKEGREKRKMLLSIKSEEVSTINHIYKNMQLNFKKD